MAKEITPKTDKTTLYLNRENWKKFSLIARQKEMVSYKYLHFLVDQFSIDDVERLNSYVPERLDTKNKEESHLATLIIPEAYRNKLSNIAKKIKNKSLAMGEIIRFIVNTEAEKCEAEGESIEDRPKKTTRERIEVYLQHAEYNALFQFAKKQGMLLNHLLWKHFPDFTDDDFGQFNTPVEKGRTGELKNFRNIGNDPRGPWQECPLAAKALKKNRPDLFYSLTNPLNGEIIPSPNTGWKYPLNVVMHMANEGRILWPERKKGRVQFKKYLAETAPELYRTYLTVYPEMSTLLQEQSARLNVPKPDILRAFTRYLCVKLKLKTKPKK